MTRFPLLPACAGAALLAGTAAWAQTPAAPGTSVTLYGVVDAGVNHTTNVLGGSRQSLVSGVMDGSRMGLRGNEDLGGGWRALFTLENRLELDTGATSNRPLSGTQLPDRLTRASLLGLPATLQPVVTNVANGLGQTVGVNLANRFWDRQAFVGLVTPVGAVLAGRQYTPAYEVTAEFDIMQTQSALSAGQVGSLPASTDIRQSNAVQYRIVLGGLTAGVMAAAGEGAADQGRFVGGMAIWRTPQWSVGVGINQRDNENSQESLRSVVVGASAAIGAGRISAMVATARDDNPSGLSGIRASLAANPATAAVAGLVTNAFATALRQDSTLTHLGYRHTIGAHTGYVAVSRLDDRRAADADTTSFGLGYTYAFSRRTDLNLIWARFDNRGLGQALPGQAGMIGGVTTSAGVDSDSLTLGLRHRF